MRTGAAHYALLLPSDLLLATNEAATTLISHALPANTLTCTFSGDDTAAVQVILSAATTGRIKHEPFLLRTAPPQDPADKVNLEGVPPSSSEEN
ncbi:hypothetical protein ABH922_005271 [Rhodococcus sp. 27YEA15]